MGPWWGNFVLQEVGRLVETNVPWDWKTLGGGGEGKLGASKAVRALAVPMTWKRIKQSELQRALDLPDRFRHDFTSLLTVTVTTTKCYYLQ